MMKNAPVAKVARKRKLYAILGEFAKKGTWKGSLEEINFISGTFTEGVNGTMYPVCNTYRRAVFHIKDNPNQVCLVPMAVAKQFGLTPEDFAR